jgi:hypothetical protein
LLNVGDGVGVPGVERGGCAKAARHFKASIVHIENKDPAGACEQRSLQRQETDHAGSDDDNCIVRRNRGKGHGVNRDRDGFNESRVRKRHIARQWIRDARRDGHVLGKCARAAEIGRGNSDDFAIIAQIHLTSAAVEALAAEDGRVKRDVVAGLKISHRAADSLDDSRGFMPHDDGRETSSRASIVSMHVASADAARVNANEQVISAGLRFRHIDEVELIVLRENKRLH